MVTFWNAVQPVVPVLALAIAVIALAVAVYAAWMAWQARDIAMDEFEDASLHRVKIHHRLTAAETNIVKTVDFVNEHCVPDSAAAPNVVPLALGAMKRDLASAQVDLSERLSTVESKLAGLAAGNVEPPPQPRAH